MGSYTKVFYYCDDCKQEVENKNDLYEVFYQLGTGQYGDIGKIQKQVCSMCFNYYSKLYIEFENKINNATNG